MDNAFLESQLMDGSSVEDQVDGVYVDNQWGTQLLLATLFLFGNQNQLIGDQVVVVSSVHDMLADFSLVFGSYTIRCILLLAVSLTPASSAKLGSSIVRMQLALVLSMMLM